MRRALLFVYLDTHFIELCRVADLLKRAGGWQPVFMFAYRYPASTADVERCHRSGFVCIDESGEWLRPGPAQPAATMPAAKPAAATPAAGRPARGLGIGRWVLRWVPGRLRDPVRDFMTMLRQSRRIERFLARWFPRLPILLLHYRAQAALAERIMATLRPDLVILPEDNIEYITGFLVRAAKPRGVPTVVVPYTIVNAEEIAEAYWHNPQSHPRSRSERLVCRLFPRWVRVHRGRKLMRLPADWIVAFELLRMTPPLPWIINSGDVDAIAVEGPFMLDYYLAAGLPRKQLVVTGALYDDIVYRQLQAAESAAAGLRRRLGIGNSSKPLLLCALPPDQFPSGRPGAEFGSYREMLSSWAQAFVEAAGYEVLVRLHPRTLRRDVQYLEHEFGLRIVEEDTASLVPLCDVYVASVSATIRLAVACGKPVINYDCYRFRYSDFRDVPGVITIESLDDFKSQLARLLNVEVREALAAKQRAFAQRANLIDGRSGERMLALFERLTRKGEMIG